MPRILKREAAKRDLIAQWVWYAENAGVEVADRFLDAVGRTLAVLASQPECGTRTPMTSAELKGIRRFPVMGGFGKILVFYFQVSHGVDLVRVIHASRDLERLLNEEPL